MSMFSDLKRIWEEQSFTAQIVDEFISMLDNSEEMLAYALKVVKNKGKIKNSEQRIYIKDQKINMTEREIRKRILIRLSTNPGGNIPACLALINITKDAERIGDYVKNVFELNTMFKEFKDGKKLFKELFDDLGGEVLALFAMVRESFLKSDTTRAIEAAEKARAISKRCEKIIEDLLDSDYPASQAVVLALGSRYIKRIALHLSNIATSIFLPLPEMDFSVNKPQ